MTDRHLTPTDRLLMTLDNGLRTVFAKPPVSERPDPAENIPDTELSPGERQLAGRLMRINHAGEVSAQGLYQGQALTARLPGVRAALERSALEENDHLAWCQRRTQELGTHVSYLNPLWYLGSLAIGATAGVAGDRWSLGFVAETERQVIRHLEGHLARLPLQDSKSRAILEQMKEDEARHGNLAAEAGGRPLPLPLRGMMGLLSKVMTTAAYWV